VGGPEMAPRAPPCLLPSIGPSRHPKPGLPIHPSSRLGAQWGGLQGKRELSV